MTMDPPMYFFFAKKNMEFASESDPPGPNPSPIFLGKESMLQGFSLREEHVSPESWKNMGEIHRKIRRTIRRKIHRTSVQNLREIIWKTMESCLRIWDFWTFLDIASLSTCSYWDQTTFHVKKARYCNSFNFFLAMFTSQTLTRSSVVNVKPWVATGPLTAEKEDPHHMVVSLAMGVPP